MTKDAIVVSKGTTPRREMEEEFKESEERYRTILENIEDGCFETNLAGRFTFFNDALCRIHGYSKNELMGMHYKKYTYEDDIEKARQSFNRVYTTGEPSKGVTWRTTTKNGTKKFLEISVSLMRDPEGRPVGFRGIARDITERKQMDETLRDSEEKYRTILENIEDGYFEIDLAGSFTFFNDAMCRIHGYPRNELMGMHYKKYMDEDDIEGIRQSFNRVYTTGKPSKGAIWRITTKNGTKKFLETPVSLMRDSEGQPIGFRGIARDITERKRMDEILRESEEKYRTILESIEDGYFETDLAGKRIFHNDALCRIYGYSREELLSMNYKDYTHKDDAKKVFKAYNLVYATGEPSRGIAWRITTKNGTKKFIETSISLMRDAEGRPIGFRGIVRDVTKQKKMEEKLRKAGEKAEAANVAKSQFLASMSHEIRTPMNAIIGVTELLAGTSLYDEQKEYVDMVQISANSLLGIINDVLDLSKIEAGGLDLEETQFDIREVIETTGITLATRAYKKGTELLCHIHQAVPTYITGDSVRVRQILVNLAGNAIKFTEQGEIVIKTTVEKKKGDRMVLHFCVSDTGIGIPKEKQEKIFESFTQADGSTTRKYGGTGLGLTISKQLIEKMGGRIWVESKEGKGSSFHFTLPTCASENPEGAEDVVPMEVKQLRTLIVDDSRINRLILRELLSAWGGLPAEVEDGTSALKALEAATKQGTPHQFIILDKNMPDMDGFETAQKIKKLRGYANVPIILLTSSEEKGDRRKADAMGISKVF